MWYAMTYLRPSKPYYNPVLVFIRSIRRGAIPKLTIALATPKKTREIVRAWDVMRLHGVMCREYIEPYTGRWMTEEEFKRIVKYIVEKCYRDPKTKRRKLEMFEEWLSTEPRFGEPRAKPMYEIFMVSKEERISLVGNECIQAYKVDHDTWLYRYALSQGLHEYRKSYILAIRPLGDPDNIYFVVINKKCLEKDNVEIPHIPGYGVKAISEILQELPRWLSNRSLYSHLLPEKLDPRLIELLKRIMDSYKQLEPDQETSSLMLTLDKLYQEYSGIIVEMRVKMNLKPVVLPKPIDDAIADILLSLSRTVKTTNPEDLKKKLAKYIDVLNKVIEVNKERMVEAVLLS
jgi:hypothetical protein